MLYLLYKNINTEITYTGDQDSIIHLEADLYPAIDWAGGNNKRWAFSLSNASARLAEFRYGRNQLNEIDWQAVQSDQWQSVKDKKQAEFLVENKFPFELISKIGVYSDTMKQRLEQKFSITQPFIIESSWYY